MHLLKWTFPDGPDGRIEIELEQNSQESKYAILSHRWGKAEDEVTFQDMLSGSEFVKTKAGYAKLENCCRQAHQDGHERVWSDTCCIDKSSSAELSEAVISMYSYYENSQVCYAFLNDVAKRTEPPAEGGNSENGSALISESTWFERGWTLQELIAPETVKFFDASWKFLGKKTEVHISKDIEQKSGIHRSVLENPRLIRAVSVSNRMSWASRRKTTRIEDRSYSLMGIFGVYMSPIYGEGHNAFIRLQEEIMRNSNDHTLFAWTLPPPEEIPQRRTFEHVSTMLALSPDQFKESSEFVQRPYDSLSDKFDAVNARLDYTTTNAGLSINLSIAQIDKKQGLYAAILACTEGRSPVPSAILLHTTASTPRGYFWRANTDAGPIERVGKLWFQAAGRDELHMMAVYILPKLSSISQTYIEPHWSPLKYQEPKAVPSVELPAPVNSIATITTPEATPFLPPTLESEIPSTPAFETRRSLVQAKDPCFEELQNLSQARHTIFGQAAQLYKKSEHQRLFPENFSWQSSDRFFGRSAELRWIKDKFERRDPTTVLISGIGKIGKTELARELACRCRDGHLFSSIIWIDASTSLTIYQGFNKVAKEIGLGLMDNEPLSEVSYKVLQWFNGLSRFLFYTSGGSLSVRWLLIFDGPQDSRDLGDVWNQHSYAGTARILVTSRNSTFGSDLGTETVVSGPYTMFLGPLDNGEANQMLQSLTHTNEDFSGVVPCWDGTPLTIAHVSNVGPEEQFHHRFNEHIGSRLLHKRNSMALSESLKHQFDELHPSSFALLCIISFFDASSMCASIFFPLKSLPFENYPQNGEDFSTYLYHLQRSSLIMRGTENDGLYILRLVQNEVRDRLAPDTYKKALAAAISLLYNAWFPRVLYLNQRQRRSNDLLPHLLRLERLAESSRDSELDFSTKEMLDHLVRSSEDLQPDGDFVGVQSSTAETENEIWIQ